jgi:restriction endonuclease
VKLREMIRSQEQEREEKDRAKRQAATAPKRTYRQDLEAVREAFETAHSLSPQQKGYALERIFVDLMRISGVPVEEPFRIVGEQLDGAVKHDGHYYLVELKWFAEPLEPKHVGSFYFKVEGKLGARGITIAMNGYTSGVLESVAKGKELKILLLDGNHLANVIYGHYTFQELLDHAIKSASLQGQLYCPHSLRFPEAGAD